MAIKGADGLTAEQAVIEVERGAKFVVFPYCMSAFVVTFRRNSDIHYIRPGEIALVKSLPYLAISLVLGWWGFPWGLIYTPIVLYQNLRGGKDVTAQVLAQLGRGADPQSDPGQWPPAPGTPAT
jgi:hypothetical protein